MLETIPVTVIGGYLGSGKTTLVNHLLRHAGGARLAIMVNDFGELPIDESLIEATGDDIISLAGGCVCCSYGSDLMAAMTRMSELDPPPDNVILETSGVALPGAISSTISLLSSFKLHGVVVLVDAETVRDTANDKYLRDTIERQLADADLVILNKSDLVAKSEMSELRDWLMNQIPNTQIIKSVHSNIPPGILLQNFGAIDRGQRDGPYQHDLKFETRQLDMPSGVDVELFASELVKQYPQLVRAKGFATDRVGQMKTVQIVGKRIDISDAPADAVAGMVIILVSSESS